MSERTKCRATVAALARAAAGAHEHPLEKRLQGFGGNHHGHVASPTPRSGPSGVIGLVPRIALACVTLGTDVSGLDRGPSFVRYSHDWSFIARSLAHGAQDVNPITANGGARRVPGNASGNARHSAPEWRGAAVSAGIQKRDFAQTLRPRPLRSCKPSPSSDRRPRPRRSPQSRESAGPRRGASS